jgi:hypothetical protein
MDAGLDRDDGVRIDGVAVAELDDGVLEGMGDDAVGVGLEAVVEQLPGRLGARQRVDRCTGRARRERRSPRSRGDPRGWWWGR